MTDLSPSSLAIMNSFTRGNPILMNDYVYRECMAAALRVAASQLKLDPSESSQSGTLYSCQEQLNSIADELDPTTEVKNG